ncbi:hypothetical protein ACFS5J_02875 [Flavobacterium chuncheonense]|uniref:Outer membrane protein beta-barrel domain-containing protein n=1 Tax=Flavobacterium chuncheonense TaxID=2026653 RepID=A0ABW5YK21_9FLAO
MKKLFFSCTLMICTLLTNNTTFAQRFGFEVNYGLNGVTSPSISNFSHFGAGVTYDFDETFGLKTDFGSDTFRDILPNFSKETGVNITRFSLQGTVNISTLIRETNMYNTLNLIAHAGGGYSVLKSNINTGTDNAVNVIMGLTPRFKLAYNLFLFVDASVIFNVSQHYKFDGLPAYDGKTPNSITGIMYNLSGGIAYQFDTN